MRKLAMHLIHTCIPAWIWDSPIYRVIGENESSSPSRPAEEEFVL